MKHGQGVLIETDGSEYKGPFFENRKHGCGDGFDQEFTTGVTFAEGTVVPGGRRAFRVTIEYREPEFERRRGARETPFRWTYVIAAVDADRAAADGVREFRAMAAASSVGWQRDIVSVVALADE